jgi:hypothetical protein
MWNGHFRVRRAAARGAAAMVFALLGGQLAAGATENLLVNPNFDTGLNGWQVTGPAFWDPTRDAGNSSSSGSARGVFNAPSVTGLQGVVGQCVPIAAGTTYEVGGDIYIAGGQTAGSSAFFSVVFYPEAGCMGPPPPEGGGILTTPRVTGTGAWTSSIATFTAGFGQAALISAELAPSLGGSFQANFDNTVFAAVSSPCVPDAHTLCLEVLRFQVTAVFAVGDGSFQAAQVGPLGNSSGYLWFFSPDNAEAIVKMFPGCSLGGDYWLFAAGLTNLRVVINVTDTVTGAVRTYTNPAGTAFQPIQDTAAFPCL